jgi:hypothetical protein
MWKVLKGGGGEKKKKKANISSEIWLAWAELQLSIFTLRGRYAFGVVYI